MVPRNYSSTAIILSKRNYSEADRIIVVYSKKYGKLTLMAKAVRKIKSRKRGHVEVFSEVSFSAARTKGMGILTEVETINDYKEIRPSLKKVSLAYYFCEVVAKITREEEQNDTVFFILQKNLKKLQTETKLKKLKENFIFELLTNLGYWPRNKKLIDPDYALEVVLERQINSIRVGKKVLL
ncbi:DNA repair protein RecO [Candidatus Microgenomates bacterium]|nr:DNA repair protein RecO [Candidatus Microgenomates bacterium]